MTAIEQPYQGTWHVSDNGESIGLVHGDFAIGFVARDQDDRVLGRYPSYERAMYAVLHQRPTGWTESWHGVRSAWRTVTP
jgi:hypothetical protein